MPLPPLDEVLATASVVRLPMRVRFRGLLEREAVLLHGPTGWAEFAPFPEYDDAESARWLAAAVQAGWGARAPAVREQVPVNATVPAVPADAVAGVLTRFPGCTTVKIKVAEPGQAAAGDVDRVAAVVDVLGAAARIRVDANGAWSVPEAVTALRSLVRAAGPAAVEYAEQPCATLPELAALRVALAAAHLDVPVAVDENVRKAEDPVRIAVAGAADVVLVKVAPLGGVPAALDIARTLGAEHGLPVVVSSALDTSVGIAAGVELAAALPELPYACGLATAGLFARDVTRAPLLADRGMLSVAAAAGLAVDPVLLAELAVPAVPRGWWLARLGRCHRLLAAQGTGR